MLSRNKPFFLIEEGDGLLRDVLDGQAELLEDCLVRGGRAETLNPQDPSVGSSVLVPAHRGCGLYREPDLYVRRQDLVPVCLVLGVEYLPARHVYDPRLYGALREVFVGAERKLHL